MILATLTWFQCNIIFQVLDGFLGGQAVGLGGSVHNSLAGLCFCTSSSDVVLNVLGWFDG